MLVCCPLGQNGLLFLVARAIELWEAEWQLYSQGRFAYIPELVSGMSTILKTQISYRGAIPRWCCRRRKECSVQVKEKDLVCQMFLALGL